LSPPDALRPDLQSKSGFGASTASLWVFWRTWSVADFLTT
jgi:hypothetical protein